MLIKKIEKVKIEEFSDEIIQNAFSKCKEGSIYLNTALQEKSNAFLLKAIESFQEAIEIYSRIIEPYLALSYISLHMGKNDEALKFISKALEISPKNQKAKKIYEQILNNKKKRSITTLVNNYSENKSSQKIKLNSGVFSKLSSFVK
ncbi:MAG: hypothetical protein U0457_15420 [Candidatus Sericytochromatia bacterium]